MNTLRSATKRNKLSQVLFGGAVIVTLTLSSFSAPATAEAPRAKSVTEQPAAPVLNDSVTRDKAIERESTSWQDDFSLLTTDLLIKFPKDYSDSLIGLSGKDGWIGFKGKIPIAAAALVKNVPNVEIRESLGYSAAEVNEASRSLNEVATNFVAGNAEITTYRGADTVIHVTYGSAAAQESTETPSAPEAPGLDIDDQALTEVLAEDVTLPAGLTFAVQPSEEAPTQEDFDGGRSLVGSQYCTMAFPVKRNGGPELGILTAGHCDGRGSYQGTNGQFNAPYYGSLSTTDQIPGGDMRWNWSRIMLTGQTFVGPESRTFTSYSNAPVGKNLCNNGVVTGYKCTSVTKQNIYYNVTVPVADGGGTYRAGPLKATPHVTDRGDSGGPWFYNYTAYGIHSGGCASCGSYFSEMPYVVQRLGVSLFTG